MKRFPGPLFAAVVTGGLLIEVQRSNFRGQDPLMFVMAAGLGLPLGTALTLLAERPPRWLARLPAPRLLAFLVTVLLALAYGAALHGARGQGEGYVMRYAQLSLAAHLAVAFAPLLGRAGPSGQQAPSARTRQAWQLGRQLFLRLPLSAVYALVVFGGVALALAAITHLFGISVHEDRYFQLWVVCTFVLQTWHFLAGVPQDFEALARDESYPKGLRIFAQFVLLPLLGLYLAILYAYAGKIILSGTLPSGWVGWMVSAAGGFGMLALLLLFPARVGASGRFVRRVETGFHLAILPLLGLLFVSLAERVQAYGITERRYFLFVLGLWLALASVYRLRWGRRTLTWIPLSLCLVALATSVGPWGALAVSRESQSARLTALLQKNDRLSAPSSSAAAVSFDDRREISRILDYLVETHGQATLARWPTPGGERPDAADMPAEAFMKARALRYIARWETGPETLSFHGESGAPVEVHGFDWLVPLEVSEHSERATTTPRFIVTLVEDGAALQVSAGGAALASISLAPVLERLQKERPHGRPHGKGDEQPIVLPAESGGRRFRVILTHVYAEQRGERWAVASAGGSLLVDE